MDAVMVTLESRRHAVDKRDKSSVKDLRKETWKHVLGIAEAPMAPVDRLSKQALRGYKVTLPVCRIPRTQQRTIHKVPQGSGR